MNRSPLTIAILLALSCLVPTGCASEGDEPSNGTGDELRGGYVDAKNQISSVIAFTGAGGYAKCTATRVSVDTFLTAAHCVLASPSTLLHTGPIPIYGNRSIGFLPGDIQLWAPNPQGRASDTVTPENALEIVATDVHPSCSACAPSVGNWLNGGTNDFALVRVRFIPFMNTYSRISATRVPAGSTVTVVGTGDVGNPEVAALRKFAFLPTVASPFPNYLITVGRGAGASASAAPGDSGGPVFDPRGNVVAVNSYALGTVDPSVQDANYAAHAETASPTALAWLRAHLPATSFAP